MKVRYIIMGLCALTLCSCHNGHNHSHGHDHSAHSHDEPAMSESHSESLHAGEVHFSHEQAEAIGMETERLQKASFASVIHTGGKLLSPVGAEITLTAPSNGVIAPARSALVEGSPVENGETLFYLATANLTDGDVALKAKLEYETAERGYRRAEELVKDRIISAQEFDMVKMRYELAKATYEGQGAEMGDKGLSIKAPSKGYLISVSVGAGQRVETGAPLAVVASNERLLLRADVSQRDAHRLGSIVSANFRTADGQGLYRLDKLAGKIISYGRSADGAYVPVTFEFENASNLLPGTYAEVYLLCDSKKDVISVPVSSLIEEQGVFSVFVKEDEEVFRKQVVSVGSGDGSRVEILEGLHEGDEVVTKGAYNVRFASASAAIPGHTHNH